MTNLKKEIKEDLELMLEMLRDHDVPDELLEMVIKKTDVAFLLMSDYIDEKKSINYLKEYYRC